MTSYRYKVFSALNHKGKTLCKVNIFQQENTIKAAIISGYKMKLTLLLILVFIFTIKQVAYANVPNTFWANPGENNFYVDLDNFIFPSNKAGATTYILFSQQYSINYFNNTNSKYVYYNMKTETDLPASNAYPKAQDVNEYLAVRVYPFFNYDPATGISVPNNWISYGDSLTLSKTTGRISSSYGLRGIVVRLVLRKDIIGGAVLLDRDTVIASAYGSMSIYPSDNFVPKNPLPVFRLILKAQAIPTPVECSIQANKRDVDFGDLSSADITVDGSRYGQEIQLTYRCNTPRTMPVKVNIVADNSSFSSNFITTSNPNLGIVVKHGGKTVNPWGSFDSTLNNGTGSDRIYVAPVKNPAAKTIATGDFTANAVLVLSIQ